MQVQRVIYRVSEKKCAVVLARACGVPVGRRSGGRLAMTLVASINVIIFFLFSFLFFFPVVYFSHRRSARIKKLILRKLTGAPKNPGLDPLPDHVGHFGALWWQFWNFEVLIEGMIESKYQPSSARGTHSPSASLHRLQNPKWMTGS